MFGLQASTLATTGDEARALLALSGALEGVWSFSAALDTRPDPPLPPALASLAGRITAIMRPAPPTGAAVRVEPKLKKGEVPKTVPLVQPGGKKKDAAQISAGLA
jgi:hypothetical protein